MAEGMTWKEAAFGNDNRDATLDGKPIRIVGYRNKVKGPILDEPARYVVFVEQTGDYRMGTVRATALD